MCMTSEMSFCVRILDNSYKNCLILITKECSKLLMMKGNLTMMCGYIYNFELDAIVWEFA